VVSLCQLPIQSVVKSIIDSGIRLRNAHLQKSAMNVISIPDLVMASVNFYVGLYYLLFYAKRPKTREHLPFALLCFCVGFYDIFTAGLYNSTSIGDGISWQQLQLQTAIPISICIIWFTSVFTEQRNNRIIQFLISWSVIIFIASLFASPEFSLSVARPAVKDVTLFNTLKVTYYEGVVGLAYQIEIASAILAYIYLFYLYVRYYQKTQNRALLLILICQVGYFFGVVNDFLVAMQVYTFIYASEYLFFFIILAMAYALWDKFVNLQTAYEELNANLELKVSDRTSEIEKLNEELKRLATHDSLTGVYNRRFFNEYLEVEITRAKNSIDHNLQPISASGNDLNFGLAMIDIDHFKPINDTYGHLVGDKVLKQSIEVMKRHIFTRDVLCRYGGDEFALLLTRTSSQGILQAVEKIRREINEQIFIIDEAHKSLHITISAGLVSFDEVVNKDSLEILKLADDRLLRAKAQGRNRIVYSDEK
jgi:diguanylate cyclase (GGDEF)-like protein